MSEPFLTHSLKARLYAHLTASEDDTLLALINANTPTPAAITQRYLDTWGIYQTIRQTLAQVILSGQQPFSTGALQAALSLIGLPFTETTDSPPPLTVRDRESAEQLYTGFINRLIAPFLINKRINGASCTWFVSVIDQWHEARRQQTGIGFPFNATLRIKIAEPNRFAEDETGYLHLMHLFKAWETGLLAPIHWKSLAPQAQLGGYLFFIITLSGVFSRKRRQQIFNLSLTRTMDEPYSSFLITDDRSIHPHAPYDEAAADGIDTHRFIPDPVSALIHQRTAKHWGTLKPHPRLESISLQKFLQSLKTALNETTGPHTTFNGSARYRVLTALDYFSSTQKLASASRVLQTRTLPGFLWHYLEGSYETRDLRASTLLRLDNLTLGRQRVKLMDAPLSTADTPHEVRDDLTQHPVAWANEAIRLVQHYTEVDPTSCGNALDELSKSIGLNEGSLIDQLTGWIKSLVLDTRLTQKGRVRFCELLLPATVTHFNLSENLNDLDADERQEEFDALESAAGYSDKDRKGLFDAWVSLHRYLIQTQAIKIEDAPFAQSGQRVRVDAQYFSEVEFHRAQRLLQQRESIGATEDNICLLVMTLAYRLGLRRSEVTKLATHHISLDGDDVDMLSVLWWSERRLKTPSSTRTLPIHGLLRANEVAWLKLWAHTRRAGLFVQKPLTGLSADELKAELEHLKAPDTKATKETFLFLGDVALNKPKEREQRVQKIIDQIHWAMREASQSKDHLRFHHLRHSCATNTTLLLMSGDLPNSQNFCANLMYGRKQSSNATGKPYAARISDLKDRISHVRSTLLGNTKAQGPALYAVSRLLGHSSPITSLKSYIHVVDLLLGAFLHERFFKLPKALQNAIHPDAKTPLKKKLRVAKDADINETLLKSKKIGFPKGRSRKKAYVDR